MNTDLYIKLNVSIFQPQIFQFFSIDKVAMASSIELEIELESLNDLEIIKVVSACVCLPILYIQGSNKSLL